jgi:phenylalanyl-tRNA synthetase beta chain
MRVSFNWLEELVELPKGTTPAQVAERLTSAGLEVEGIEDLAAGLEGIVVARVARVEPHPQADRLSVCTVEAGGAPLTIVCGAQNVAEGVFACLAPVGASMPLHGTLKGKAIEATTIRGVASEGMLCSAQELGLGWSTDGLLLLDPALEGVSPGARVAPALGRNDAVLTLSVTPNRPDALSHVGVARELAASFKTRLRVQAPTCAERGGPVDDLAKVTIEDVDGCPRYACRVIEGVVIQPSPLWMVARLAACGIRSINTVVDVTNLIMMERGIPLHAFDYDKLGKEKLSSGTSGRAAIIVRSARAGERLKTLDDKDRELLETDLVIADPERAVALAGVMGGADTEVTPTTTRILLECAYFAPGRVRKTARRLSLHSEASHRFERGCDPNGVPQALDRAAALIAELSLAAMLAEAKPGTGSTQLRGGLVARGVIDVYPKKVTPAGVSLRPKRAAQLLGLSPKVLDEAMVSKNLLALGLEVDGREAEAIRFRVPTWRPDLTREIDLIEELLRLIGADAVPTTLPARASEVEGLYDARRHRVLETARAALEAAGFDEAVNLAFVSPQSLDPFDGGEAAGRIALKNPLGEEMSVLRKSLLPGLLENAGTNHRRGNFDVRLYETATVFLGKNPGGKTPNAPEGASGADAWAREVVRIAGVAAGGNGHDAFDRRAAPIDFFDLKGVLEELLDALGVHAGLAGSAVSFVPADDRYPFLHPRARAEVWVKLPRAESRTWVGLVGEIHPDLVARHEIKGRAVGFELDVEALARIASDRPRARPLPRFPAVRRDFALVVDDALGAAELCARLGENGAVRGLLESIDVFDVYKGGHIPTGKKSLAIGLTLRASDRTLTDEEVARVTGVLLDDARAHFGAEVRV